MATSQLSNEDGVAIRALFDAVPRLFVAGDFAGWSELFTADALLMPPNNPSVKGRSALVAFGQSFPKVRSMSFSDVQIEGTEDLAVGRSAYTMTIVPEGAGEVQDTGKQLVIFRKQSDGNWLASTGMFNSDLAVGT